MPETLTFCAQKMVLSSNRRNRVFWM
uniref:Uncharacterized protein n=1 Tax=Arundo donax TaxID=35708 RepID=A0A0A9E845_ARUDO